jgi:hypothetical protein
MDQPALVTSNVAVELGIEYNEILERENEQTKARYASKRDGYDLIEL